MNRRRPGTGSMVGDTSPGYERTSSPDFDRLIDSACLFCHADNGKFIGSDGRRFSGVALNPIGCDRCHGSGEDHIRQPSAKNIVNPSKLPRRARDSICEQCHLEGENRLLNPGKTWQGFHPGDELERTAVTYLLTQNNQQVKAVEPSREQLARSANACARAAARTNFGAQPATTHMDRPRTARARSETSASPVTRPCQRRRMRR